MFSPYRVIGRLASCFPSDYSAPTRKEIAIADAFRGILQNAMYGDIDCADEDETLQIDLDEAQDVEWSPDDDDDVGGNASPCHSEKVLVCDGRGITSDMKYKDLSSLHAPGSSSSEEQDQALLPRMQQPRRKLETRTSRLSTTLDMPEPIARDQQVRVEQNLAAARNLLEKARDRLIDLSFRLGQISAKRVTNKAEMEVSSPNLAPMPIPKRRGARSRVNGTFSGVYSTQFFTKYQQNRKDDLLEELSGPAKDFVRDLQVDTVDSYDVAIQFLRRKYDNQKAVLGQLLQQIQDVSDQNQLFDRILVVFRLDQREENT